MFQTPLYKKTVKVSKVLLGLVLAVFIVYKLFFSYQINTLFQRFEQFQSFGSVYFLISVLILMLFNWGIESVKWRLLINRFEPISYSIAVKAVLSGVTLSILTPNQIGDFAGRVIHLSVLNKIKGSLITVIGHFAQVIITLFFGVFALYYFSHKFPLLVYLAPIGFLLTAILVFCFLNLKVIYNKIHSIKWIHKLEKYVEVFGAYTTRELLMILALSFFRYLVFLSQYYLLLRFFQVQIAFLPAIACIIATFCVQSIVPSFLILELGIRGASAWAFFSIFSPFQEGVLLSAYSLWIVNMLIPSLIGMYYIYRVRT